MSPHTFKENSYICFIRRWKISHFQCTVFPLTVLTTAWVCVGAPGGPVWLSYWDDNTFTNHNWYVTKRLLSNSWCSTLGYRFLTVAETTSVTVCVFRVLKGTIQVVDNSDPVQTETVRNNYRVHFRVHTTNKLVHSCGHGSCSLYWCEIEQTVPLG